MKKSDLKTGMLVEKRNGTKSLVLKDTEKGDILISKDGWCELDDYDENLKFGLQSFSHMDIMKVYELDLQYKAATRYWDEYDKVLWERKEKEKPTLTDAEKAILESLDKKYKYIARDESDELYVYREKPHKTDCIWDNTHLSFKELELFAHLFQFVKWEDDEPYKIEDLIKGC